MIYLIYVLGGMLACYGAFVGLELVYFAMLAGPADKALNSLSKNPLDWKLAEGGFYLHKSGMLGLTSTSLYASDVKLEPTNFRYNASVTFSLTAGQESSFNSIIEGYKQKKVAVVVNKALQAEKEAVKAIKAEEKAVKKVAGAGTF